MGYKEIVIEAYSKLQERMTSEGMTPTIPFLGFDEKTEQTLSAFSVQETEFTRELINQYNTFADWLNRLIVIEKLIEEYDDELKPTLWHEFSQLPMDFCLQFPYRFKGNLTYCSTQLCYTAGIALAVISQDRAHEATKINLNSLIEVAINWQNGQALVDSIRMIDSDALKKATSNFRHSTQHRFARRLNWGHTIFADRIPTSPGRVTYLFGFAPPIGFDSISPLLAEEAKLMRDAFDAFKMLRDQLKASL